MSKHFNKLIVVVSAVISLVLLLVIPSAVLADGPNTQNIPVTPKIEIADTNWLVISYSGQVNNKIAATQSLNAYLANALSQMNSSNGIISLAGGISPLVTSNSMGSNGQQNYGNSYVYSSFSTDASWSSSPASFWGSSSAAWYGTSPSSDCSVMQTTHVLTPDQYESYIDSVPSGWTNEGGLYATSNAYQTTNNWYLGTAWSGVTAGNVKGIV